MATFLRVGLKDYEALGPHEAVSDRALIPFKDEDSARSFLSRVHFEMGSLQALRNIAWHPGQVPESNHTAVENFLVSCLLHDTIRIVEAPPLQGYVGILEEEEATEPEEFVAQEEVTETSWIEIELIDMEDGPVPGERYIVTLPDGTEKEGRIGATGIVKVAVESPGTCKVTFPDHDQEAWEPA